MDRPTVYYGQIPLETDLLKAGQYAMVGLAKLAEAVLGTSTMVDGFTLVPAVPASLSAVLSAGSIFQLENLEATAWSSLPADLSHSIVKHGVNLDTTTLTFVPPSTVGYAQNFLVEVQYEDLDTGSVTLPYYNAADPTVPFSGPGNSGTAQNTVRKGIVAVQVKAGVAATAGTQATPSADAGWTGLFVVTLAQGDTSVTSGAITQLSTAPFIDPKLPAVPTAVQSGTWLWAVDTSAGAAAQVTSASTTTASAVLTFASVPSWVAAGMKAYDLTTTGAITGAQTVLSKTATTVTLSANVNATVNSGDAIAFSNNALVASATPVPPSLTPGMKLHLKAAGTNSGAVTLNVNGLGVHNLIKANGTAMLPGDIVAGMALDVIWDGTQFQTPNYIGQVSSGSTVYTSSTLTIPYAADSSVTVNSIVAPFTPAISVLAAGDMIKVKLANSITGPTTCTVNALAPIAVKRPDGTPLQNGDGYAGQIAIFEYDGTNLQMVNVAPATANYIPGHIYTWPTATAPTGTLECNGTTVSRSTYARLFSIIGVMYGAGDGSTTFNLPDFRGEFLRGWDHGRGVDPDRATRTSRGDGTTGDNVGTKETGQAGPVSLSGASIEIDNPQITYSMTGVAPFTGPSPFGVYDGSGGYAGVPYLNAGSGGSNSSDNIVKLTGSLTISGNSGSTETRPRNVNVMYVIAA